MINLGEFGSFLRNQKVTGTCCLFTGQPTCVIWVLRSSPAHMEKVVKSVLIQDHAVQKMWGWLVPWQQAGVGENGGKISATLEKNASMLLASC